MPECRIQAPSLQLPDITAVPLPDDNNSVGRLDDNALGSFSDTTTVEKNYYRRIMFVFPIFPFVSSAALAS